MAIRRITSAWLALALLLLGAPAQGQTSVAVMDLAFQGEIPPWMSARFRQELERGLGATGLKTMPAEEIRQAMVGSGGSCLTAACRKALGAKLRCDYLVGGTIKGEARSYTFQLWIANARTGEQAATVNNGCDICGQAKVFARLELVASELSATMASRQDKQPAQLLVRSAPGGAAITVDGEAMGTTPRTVTLPPGKHTLTVQLEGYIPGTLEYEARAGVSEPRTITLIPRADTGGTWRILGWSAMGAGVAAVAAGVVLLALDGSEGDCSGTQASVGQIQGQCLALYDTLAPGAALAGVGAAALGAAGYLLYRGYQDKAPAKGQAAIRFTGAGITGRF